MYKIVFQNKKNYSPTKVPYSQYNENINSRLTHNGVQNKENIFTKEYNQSDSNSKGNLFTIYKIIK